MKRLIRWAIDNTPAMNMLMVGVLAVGMASLAVMRREVFPEFELEIVLVSVPYPGASPEEVEQAICQKIEEAVRSLDGIKKITSVAKEGAGSVVLELRADVVDVQKIVTEVRSEVDRIPSFPELAEDPEVQQVTMRQPAIFVAVMAPENRKTLDLLELRSVAEQVRDDLLQLNSVSQVDLLGAQDYQIDIEIDQRTLREYGLTLQEVARIVGRENLEIPAGTIRTPGAEVLLRGKNKRLEGAAIAELPLVTDATGVVLTVGDLATVRDAFVDSTAISELNGRPALVLSVTRTTSEDLLEMARDVRAYAEQTVLAGGYSLIPWGDRSVDVRDRLELLQQNGLLGLLLVFLVLTVFLELKLAFWVALGIPVALLGAGGELLFGGQTLNMLSMFAFLMALGIVVDDAIVVGENIYAHRQQGKPFVRAAVDGTYEVMPSVVTSVTTTIVAFCPLFFVSGVMGKFIAVMPFAIVAMLIISLLESLFVLPCHLAHDDAPLFRLIGWLLSPLSFLIRISARVNAWAARMLERLIHYTYLPTLRWAICHRGTTLAAALAILLVTGGLVRAGFVPFIVFPKLDSNYLRSTLRFPDGTPAEITDQMTRRITAAIEGVNERHASAGMPIVELVYRRVGQAEADQGAIDLGSHLGSVDVQLVDTSQRTITSEEIIRAWRDAVEEIAGAESVSFGAVSFGPPSIPLEFKLLAPGSSVAALEAAVQRCKEKLATYSGVFDISDDARPGKWEMQLRVKERAQAMGIRTAELAESIRGAYYGEEVMRLQRGRHEVKLMVRYPRDQRRSLGDFRDIRLQTSDGEQRALSDLAEVTVRRGYSEINRVDQKRAITIRADLDENEANAREIVQDLQQAFMPDLLAEFPGVTVVWEGQQEQQRESVSSLIRGTGVALLVMFVILTLEFRSYLQPILILVVIPFGITGAIWGHAIMGLPLTLFSFFGLVALTGVVVNDSIVLIDFINRRVREGMPIHEALLDAGQRRFRPVLLTSATTIAGLLPILLETSFQAQILIPMATSLSFGLLLATVLVLVLVPTLYSLHFQWFGDVAQAEATPAMSLPQPQASRPGSPPASPIPDGVALRTAEEM